MRARWSGADRIYAVTIGLASNNIGVGNRIGIGAWFADVIAELLTLFPCGALHDIGHDAFGVSLPVQCDQGVCSSNDAQLTGSVRRRWARLGLLSGARRVPGDRWSSTGIVQLGSGCGVPSTHKVLDRSDHALKVSVFRVRDASMWKRIIDQIIFDQLVKRIDPGQKQLGMKMLFQDLVGVAAVTCQ